MTPKPERTPGPWMLGDVRGHVVGQDGRLVAGCMGHYNNRHDQGPENLANAAFIVLACNAHDELVAALRDLIGWLDDDHPGPAAAFRDSVEKARAVLAKVEGK